MILPDPVSLRVLHLLQNLRAPALDRFALSVSGGGRGIWVLLAATLFFWFFGPRRGWRLAFALIAADLFCDALKNLLQVPRPWMADPTLLPDPAAIAGAPGFSFPSGHVVNASSLAFALAAEAPPRARPAVWTLAVLWTALMAFSRMFLCVHTPADVLAAALLSALAVWTVHRLFALADSRPAIRPALHANHFHRRCTTEGAAEIDFGAWWHTYFRNSVLAYFFLYGSLVYFCCSYGKGTPKKKKKY